MNTDWANSYNYTPGDAVELDWQATKAMFPDSANPCMLVAIDWRSISTIISVLRFAEYWHIWGLPAQKGQWSEGQKAQWQEITAHIGELEACLMSGCNVADLIKTNQMLVAAITGEPVDLTAPLPDEVDFGGISVSDRLKDVYTRLGTLDVTMEAGLKSVKESIDAQAASGGDNLEDNLDNIKLAIEAIALVAAA